MATRTPPALAMPGPNHGEKMPPLEKGSKLSAVAEAAVLGYVGRVMRVSKLLHTRYRLNDLERSVKFYKEVLGLEEVRRHKSPRGSELVFLKAPESEETIELCHFPNSGPVEVQADLTHLAFQVDSLEEFGKHLATLGLKYSDGPTMRPDGSGGFAFVDAPEGYEIELIQRGAAAAAANQTY